ncbi:MAG TPA: hypothetical protein VGJ05_05130 [Fimbriiglobus sp.]|jgi:hypothetical protein
MTKVNISLQPSEAVVTRCASAIYAAYISAGKVGTGQEREFMMKAIEEAIWIARTTDEAVQSDGEMG